MAFSHELFEDKDGTGLRTHRIIDQTNTATVLELDKCEIRSIFAKVGAAAALTYLKFYNKSAPDLTTPSTDYPFLTLPLTASTHFGLVFDDPLTDIFTDALTVVATSTANGNATQAAPSVLPVVTVALRTGDVYTPRTHTKLSTTASNNSYAPQPGTSIGELLYEVTNLGVTVVNLATQSDFVRAINVYGSASEMSFIKFYSESATPATPSTDYPTMVIPCKSQKMSISLIDEDGIQGATGGAGGLDAIATITRSDNTNQVAPSAQVDLDLLTTTS